MRAYHSIRRMASKYEFVKDRKSGDVVFRNPGKWFRDGLTLQQFFRQFPDDATAEQWFAEARWDGHPACPRCGVTGDRVAVIANRKPQPYRCKECRRHFSVKSGGIMDNSRLGYQTWLLALYLLCTNLKGVSSMRIHRELGTTQKAAWHLAHRIRAVMEKASGEYEFGGPVEVDETYIGGKRKNMHQWQRDELEGRGATGKIAVAGIKDRATGRVALKVIESTDRATLHAFIDEYVEIGATVYTDDALAYRGLDGRKHRAVKHSLGEFVRGIAHTNGIESLWSTFKRGYLGTYHLMSAKHISRYLAEFAFRQNFREENTMDQMRRAAAAMGNLRLTREKLTSGPPAFPRGRKTRRKAA